MSDVQPEFDREGYPTEGTLDHIRHWHVSDLEGVLRFVAAAWRYPEYAREVRPGIWTFATGGWSGNEELIGALQESAPWLDCNWNSIYLPGGLTCIAVGEAARGEMKRLHEKIRDWCWRKR